MTRWAIAVAVAAVGVAVVATVEGLQQHEAAQKTESTPDCTLDEYPRAAVTVRAAVETDNVDYPRISSDVVIRAPRMWNRADDLLGDPDHSDYRSALRCLLGAYPTDFSVYRNEPPTITVEDGDVVVHDHVWTELVQSGHGAVGMLDLNVERAKPWRLAVVSRGGLSRSTSWNVTITAPVHWLASSVPQPWPPHDAKPGEVTWYYGTTSPMDDQKELAITELTPDVRTTVYVWHGSTFGDLMVQGVDAVSAAAFPAVILLFIRRIRKHLSDDGDKLARRARRVTIAVLIIQFVGLGIQITRAILAAQGDRVPDWSTAAWAADIAVGLAVLVLARCSGVRRRPLFAAVPVLVATLAFGWVLGDNVAFTGRWEDDALFLRLSETAMVFVVLLLAVAGFVDALRSLTRSNGKRPRRAWWVWPVTSVVTGALVLERVITALHNDSLQQWINDPGPTGVLRGIFRYTLWGLPGAWLWIFGALPAVAVYVLARTVLQHKSDADRSLLWYLSLALFVAGPVTWSLTIYGFELPFWLLGALVYWLCCRAGKPLLDSTLPSGGRIRDYATQQGDAAVRRDATRWLKHAAGPAAPRHPKLPKQVTPVDVVLALGPGRTPYENMRTMVRFSWWMGVTVAVVVYFSRKVASADLTAASPDSLILQYAGDIVWTAAGWVLAAAALGLYWQYLPGKRGFVKVLPLAVANAVGPICVFLASKLTGGTGDVDELIDGAVFTIVLFFLGLAMDIRTLRDLGAARYLTLRQGMAAYGVSNLPSRITAAVAPVSAVIALVFTIIAGPQSNSTPASQPPSPETGQNKPNTGIK
ncbi:hypothetical protein H480_05659 [Amycolatopsis vancoresmycina DSM 44592]|uniref:Uncharacterized protein n=1 Tax=Amycolatopsis vancoresmycina DSM 44592 TaxID=1292037 RepID=R1GE20_9PSEU|nr:hypothetical protein H480_05659 [Amycolatopsis vancoresmycina DSM 44592]